MSELRINAIVASGTDAERIAYTPSLSTPASGPDPSVVFITTDTNKVWGWNFAGSAWIAANAATVAYADITAIPDAIGAIDGLTPAASKLAYYTGAATAALTDFTSFGRNLVGSADAATAQGFLDLEPGVDVQAYDADLAALAGLSSTGIVARTGAGTAAVRTLTAGTGINISNGDGVSGNPTISSTVTAYTDEMAQDAVGGMSSGTGLATVTYTDGAPSLVTNVPAAAGSDVRTGTDATKALTTDAVFDAAGYVALTPGTNVPVDMSAGFNFTLAMGGNYTLDNPTNVKVQEGVIRITQDGAGSRTLAYGSNWKFAGGSDPTLSTPIGAEDVLFYKVLDSTTIIAALVKAIG